MKLTPLEQQLFVRTQSLVHAKLAASVQVKPAAIAHLAADHALAAVEAMRLAMLGNGNGNGRNGNGNGKKGKSK